MRKHQAMKNTVDGINDKLGIIEEKISELKDIAIETIQNKMEKKHIFK